MEAKCMTGSIKNLIVVSQVRYVRAQDTGEYEWLVSTVPKMTKTFHLKVVIPKARYKYFQFGYLIS